MERPDHPVTTWRKSTYSGGNGSNCVEVGDSGTVIVVRDTKNRAAVILAFPLVAWDQFSRIIKDN